MKQEQPALEQACMSEGSTGRGPRHYISLLVDGMGDGIPDKDPRSGLGQQQPRPRKVSVALQRSDTVATAALPPTGLTALFTVVCSRPLSKERRVSGGPSSGSMDM